MSNESAAGAVPERNAAESAAFEASVKALDTVRTAVLNGEPARTAIEKYIAGSLSYDSKLDADLAEYFKAPPEERVAMLERLYPNGLEVAEMRVGSAGTHRVSWRSLVPYEAWLIKNHGQPLLALASRGGRSVLEAYAAMRGETARSYNPERDEAAALSHMQKAGFLA